MCLYLCGLLIYCLSSVETYDREGVESLLLVLVLVKDALAAVTEKSISSSPLV